MRRGRAWVAAWAVGLAMLAPACADAGGGQSSATTGPAATTGTVTTNAPTANTTAASTTAAATSAPVPTAPPATPPSTCPTWQGPTVTGRVAAPLAETSGLAAGRRNPGVLWAHNDSGDTARVFAIDPSGAVVADVEVPNAVALDWEDIAIGPGPDGQPWIYVGDIGDNFGLRRTVTVFRFPEPAIGTAPAMEAAGVQRIFVAYPTGPINAETLLVDPVTGDLFVVGKTAAGDDTVPVFRVPADQLRDGATATAELVARVVGRTQRVDGPTAGDVSADGTLVAVGNGSDGFLWLRSPEEPLGALFARQPRAPCRFEPGGGEAVAFSVDGRHLWAVNEGDGARIRRYDRT